MYSKAFFSTLEKFQKLSLLLGVVPSKFSAKTCRFEEPTEKILKRSLVGIILYCFLTVFFVVRISLLFYDGGTKSKRSKFAIYSAYCFLFVLGFVLLGSWVRCQTIKTLNSYILFVMEFQSKYFQSFNILLSSGHNYFSY